MMALEADTYYSLEADKVYMSVSQFKDFMSCEAQALAKLNGEYEQADKKALLVGSYVHSYFESEEAHARFKTENEDVIFKKNGALYADFETAEAMIRRLESDAFFNFVYQGSKEEIVTGELFGTQWKAKIDVVNFEKGYFVDLKTTRALGQRYWSDKFGMYVPFVLAYDYVLQMYVYKQLLEQEYNMSFTPYIFAVSKTDPVEIAAIEIEPSRFVIEEDYIDGNIERVLAVKKGEVSPRRCEKCPYCVSTRQLRGFVEIDELLS